MSESVTAEEMRQPGALRQVVGFQLMALTFFMLLVWAFGSFTGYRDAILGLLMAEVVGGNGIRAWRNWRDRTWSP